jgi:lysozyme
VRLRTYKRVVVALFLFATTAVAAQKEPLSNDPSRSALAEYSASFEPRGRALPSEFWFPRDIPPQRILGIDVSHYQGDVDWKKVAKQGAQFVFIKATQGQHLYDPKFVKNWAGVAQLEARGLMLRRGAYHFMTADDAPTLQAQNFVEEVGGLGPDDLPPCLDLEWDFLIQNGTFVLDEKKHRVDKWEKWSSTEIVERVIQWLLAVQTATGKQPIIYTSARWWSERIGRNRSLDGYDLWIADHTSRSLGREEPVVPHGRPWLFWQLTDKGVFTQGGIRHRVDTTIYHGTAADLKKRFAFK